MLMPELQQLAQTLGITGVGRMRKSELITAIQANQANQGGLGDNGGSAEQEAPPVTEPDKTSSTVETAAAGTESTESAVEASARGRRATRPAGPPQPRKHSQAEEATDVAAESNDDKNADNDRPNRQRRRVRSQNNDADRATAQTSDRSSSDRDDNADDRGSRSERRDFDDNGGNRRRNRRHRDRSDRDRRRGGRDRAEQRSERNENTNSEDEQLLPVAGILDILDSYAFIRTTGYLAGPDDVYVSMSQVRKNKLRRGDAITGAVKPTRGDDDRGNKRREKYNPLIRLDTVNGMSSEEARNRDEFYKLTPLYPQERLRLETEAHLLTTRVIDLVTPIGKGQRALIVSPPKAGKTMVMQAIANAITTNNPECHLMVVLIDERPEEVTDMQRSVKGEVISSTFDRPPSDHTTVAELSIERAKRLVELGHDVVVLLDGITRLGRAYNNASPASGRILSGGIDSTALYPPKRFLGAARNIENGGSLTILATALVETGSMGDTVIFEEFKGTGNAELKLDRKIADKRVYPAVDVHQSSTRKDDLMMGADEQAIMLKLRRVLGSLEQQQAIDLLLDRLKKTKTNAEFLMQIVKTTPGGD
ncbi:transcription termination factor Rho [Natronoglycomyces albus]|uniref:Transcription termination factor Rho n=2 Tax=Natronoglycomyces albus TaxID=2811108 RepID=A0A895XU01_9ACTN|nr:transcription termination factor Rho [Natronoglycomyces albus]